MSSTKKGFMYAGGIIGIICSSLCILGGLISLMATRIVNFDFVKEIIDAINANATLDQNVIVYTDEMIDRVVKITKIVLTLSGLIALALSVANLVFSIKVVKQSKTYSDAKGNIITLLVLSILIGNIITMAFMIVALCLKFKPKNDLEEQSVQEIEA